MPPRPLPGAVATAAGATRSSAGRTIVRLGLPLLLVACGTTERDGLQGGSASQDAAAAGPAGGSTGAGACAGRYLRASCERTAGCIFEPGAFYDVDPVTGCTPIGEERGFCGPTPAGAGHGACYHAPSLGQVACFEVLPDPDAAFGLCGTVDPPWCDPAAPPCCCPWW